MTEPSNNGHGAIRQLIVAAMTDRGNEPVQAVVLASLTGLRARQVSNALVNMRRKGVAHKVGRDQWQLTEGPKPTRPRNAAPRNAAPAVLTGDLLEVVGTLKTGQVVARVVDTGRLYRVEPL